MFRNICNHFFIQVGGWEWPKVLINPKNVKIKAPKRPDNVYKLSDKEQEKYFNKQNKYLEQSGTYFRNNVWWWRHLAEYVIEHTKVINQDKIT